MAIPGLTTAANSKYLEYKNGPTGRLLQPTPNLKVPRTSAAHVDFSEFQVAEVPQILMSVTENPPLPDGRVDYEIRFDAKVAGYYLTWTFYFQYKDERFHPMPNVVTSARGLLPYQGYAMNPPAMRDPNKLLDFYFFNYSRWLRPLIAKALAKPRK